MEISLHVPKSPEKHFGKFDKLSSERRVKKRMGTVFLDVIRISK
jgi:hypothetical protein